MPLATLTGDRRSIEGGITRLRIVDQNVANDFLFLPHAFHSLFDSATSDRQKKRIIVAGIDKSLALVEIGDCISGGLSGRPVTPKKEKARSFFSSFFGAPNSSNPSTPRGQSPVPTDIGNLSQAISEVSPLVVFDDPKRRILRVTVDPTGKLVATADNVGRVMLFDLRIFSAIRIWKGLREARLAWTEGIRPEDGENCPAHEFQSNITADLSTSQYKHPVLCLAIYSPMTGLCNLWAMKHGPCLRSIPVGPQCYIYTVYHNRGSGSSEVETERSPATFSPKSAQSQRELTTCILLMHDQSRLILSKIKPFERSSSDIDAHKLDLILDLEHEVLNTDSLLDISTVSASLASQNELLTEDHTIDGRVELNGDKVEEHIFGDHQDFSSLEECKKAVVIINSILESGLSKVKDILELFGCCSGVVRNDVLTHSGILMHEMENSILPWATKLQWYEAGVVCISLIDAFELDALGLLNVSRCHAVGNAATAEKCVVPSIISVYPDPDHDPECANSHTIDSSNRWFNFSFSIKFHEQLIGMLENCGRLSSNYGIMVEAEVRTVLLNAYKSFLDMNATAYAFSNLAMDSDGSLGTTGSLMRYGEWRSEAFRWANRLHRLEVMRSTQDISGGFVKSGQTTGTAELKGNVPSPCTPPPPGKSIDIINLSPSSDGKVLQERPVLRKGFSFADVRPDVRPGGHIAAENKAHHAGHNTTHTLSPGSSSYALPNTAHRMSVATGAININPSCSYRSNQEINGHKYLAVCPVLPFSVFRAMHSVEPVGECFTNVSVHFRSTLLEAVLSHARFPCQHHVPEMLRQSPSYKGGFSSSGEDLKISVKLESCLGLKRNPDTGYVSKENISLGEAIGGKNSGMIYTSLLSSSALSTAEEFVASIDWIPERVRDNTWLPAASVMWDIVSFLCTPALFADAFNLPTFSRAMLAVGLGSGAGLCHALNFFAIFIERLPISALLNVYYNRPPVSVLLFR